MSNIVPANITIPTHLAKRMGTKSALSASLAGGLPTGSSGFPRISIKGARFRIVEGDNEVVLDSTSLDVVIVGANPRLSKTWYAKQWTPDSEPSAPDCFSLDGIGPHPDSASPQNDLCASCPQNAWGSKVTPQGQQIKACSDQKRLAIVAADDPTGPIYLLQVTPAALKGLNQYHKELSARGIPPEIVKTKVSFDTDASFPKLKFSFGGFIDENTQAAVDQLFDSEQVKEITGEVLRQIPEVPKLAAPAPVSPKPVVEEKPEPVAPASEEAPRRGFGGSKPAAKAAPKAAKSTKPAETQPSAASLADEIAALVGEVGEDDA